MRKLTNLISPLLKKYRYRNKKDPFELFLNMKKSKSQNNINENVVVLPLRVSPTSNTFEGILSYALKLRGYKVYALMCNQILTKCENINQKQHSSLACSLCNYEQKRFSKTFEVEHVKYIEEIGLHEYEKIVNISNSVRLEDIFSYKYKNVPLGKYVEGGVARYLLISNIDLISNEKLIREFFLTALLTSESTKKLIKRTNPKFVVASHGIYSTWGTAVETCIADGYRVVVWGRGYIGKGNMVASHNSSYLFEAITEDTNYWKDTKVSSKVKDELDLYFNSKKDPHSGVDHVNYYSDIKKSENDIFKSLSLNVNRRRIGIYPNIPWDGKMFSSTEEFPDINIFIKAILEWANKNPDVDMIIRAHPAEAYRKGNESIERFIDILNEESKILPKNIIYIEPTSSINSYQLSEICDAALMYASTLALEFAYAKHPVIQVGLNNVSNKGIVFDAFTKDTMFSYLDRAISGELKVDDKMYSRVVQYSNYWNNKKHIPETLFKLDHLSFDGYSFDDANKLSKDNNKVLDWFIDRCEDGKPFIWEG